MRFLAPDGGRGVRIAALAILAGIAGYLAQSLAPAVCGQAVSDAYENYGYPALVAAAGALALAQALRGGRDRLAWAIAGTGTILWAGGDLAGAFGSGTGDGITLSDVLWLSFYPAAYAAVILLVRSRLAGRGRGLWLDGLVAALAVAALATALVWGPVSDAAQLDGSLPIDLAYLVGDLLLLGLVAAALVTLRWRPGRPLAWFGAGLALSAVADAFFLYEAAADLNLTTTAPATLWPLAALACGLAAWQPVAAAPRVRAGRLATLVTPGSAGALALGVLVYGRFAHLGGVAAALAVGALALTLVRVTGSFAENVRLLREAESQAKSDALTGLANRRALMLDLEAALVDAVRGDDAALILFDLDGFKHYNDAFGHPAGDALLARLGERLASSLAGRATTYRLGGDEFCALLYGDASAALDTAEIAAEALSDRGSGFEVGTSFGLVLLPDEASEAAEALQVADRRLYLQKGERQRASVTRQTGDVLLQALYEREPDLRGHVGRVAELAAATAALLGLDRDERERIARAAELHDVGKMAVPDAILAKPGPLDEREWAFMRQHTIVGERILRAAPALGHVAPLVRASHEHYDGTGYPDRLAGEEIPLGARIVAVCDAYHAMTTDRPYSPAHTPAAALAELDRCAGVQFDPAVVEAFRTALSAHPEPAAAAARPRAATRV
ncbi:MAG: hypothetical protein QOE28_2459 [Solirubrobacteraceae bacterium]|nr:hypothetical protein [Solirubrobacteraceae bacterium]